ncbi:hypothetical protein [Lactococcus garvieae]|uniref:hypothetical protein n=1 Tax=Lactococcus garvieae TaxID=1363 RepID=UPI00254D9E55|nr:hypothetical protein [Lactococcus garvieae]
MKKNRITILLILFYIIIIGFNNNAFLKHPKILHNLTNNFSIYSIMIVIAIFFTHVMINFLEKKKEKYNSHGVTKVNSILSLSLVIFSFFIQPLKTYSLYVAWNIITLSILVLMLLYFLTKKSKNK